MIPEDNLRPLRSAPGLITASALRSIATFSQLTDAEVERVIPLLYRRTLGPRRRVHVATEMPHEVWFSLDAGFRVVAVLPSGDMATIFTCQAGQTFGHVAAILGDSFSSALQIEVERGGDVLVMSAQDFAVLFETIASVGRQTAHAIAALAKVHAARIVELTALDFKARLVAELLRLSQDAVVMNGVLTVQHAPTHAAIGARVGAAREVVSRGLQELELEGVIGVRRGILEFLDIGRLKAFDQAAVGERIDLSHKTRDAD